MSALRDAWNTLSGAEKTSASNFIQSQIAAVLAAGSTLESVVQRTPNGAVALDVTLGDRSLVVTLRYRG